ncbi:MAG: hypothetical protein EBS89_09720 [Proteobacteria bacterium]|jgi:hypothetical protein|nr:hypothetical protein [Pseudomonadota bacterium]
MSDLPTKKKVKKIAGAVRRVGEPEKKEAPPTNQYFSIVTHDAILDYQKCDDHQERARLYQEVILPSFDKLVENLIFMNGFVNVTGSYTELKNDCITFLFETIHKFDASRGSKAFSYFNVVAKNWLMIKSKQRSKNLKRMVSLDDTASLTVEDVAAIEANNTMQAQVESLKSDMQEYEIVALLNDLKDEVQNENERACMDAIFYLFDQREEIELLNKRAVFVYMRDMSSLSPKQLSAAMSAIRRRYRDLIATGHYDIY